MLSMLFELSLKCNEKKFIIFGNYKKIAYICGIKQKE